MHSCPLYWKWNCSPGKRVPVTHLDLKFLSLWYSVSFLCLTRRHPSFLDICKDIQKGETMCEPMTSGYSTQSKLPGWYEKAAWCTQGFRRTTFSNAPSPRSVCFISAAGTLNFLFQSVRSVCLCVLSLDSVCFLRRDIVDFSLSVIYIWHQASFYHLLSASLILSHPSYRRLPSLFFFSSLPSLILCNLCTLWPISAFFPQHSLSLSLSVVPLSFCLSRV